MQQNDIQGLVRLQQRVAADPDPFGQLLLRGQPVAGGEGSVDDHLLDRIDRPIGDGMHDRHRTPPSASGTSSALVTAPWILVERSSRSGRRVPVLGDGTGRILADRKSTRLNSSHVAISYSVFC